MTLYEGQWRLARVEVANWGTFSGYHALDIPREGVLITGESGSGKSSLLDAITTVLTPPRSLDLNAAARSADTRGKDRTIESYMRGAWRHEATGLGEVTNSYLRANVATWSGVLLKYESGVEDGLDRRSEPLNLIALFHLKAGCNTSEGRTSVYVIVRGEHSLVDFQEYVRNGIDTAGMRRSFKDAGIQVFRDHSSFSERFCRAMGINSAKTLELLHKTQAAKNFGSLDDLFRRFMLEEPETFKQADVAVEQFGELDGAHRKVVEQREQRDTLAPLISAEAAFSVALLQEEDAQRRREGLERYVEELHVNALRRRREKLARERDRLSDEREAAERELESAVRAYDRAHMAFMEKGGASLDVAKHSEYEHKLTFNQRQAAHKQLIGQLPGDMRDSFPVTRGAWDGFVREIRQRAEEAETSVAESEALYEQTYGRIADSKERISKIEAELEHLIRHRTNIPVAYDTIRCDVAKAVGMQPSDLPFVGELIEVKSNQTVWQGAIERVLRSQARTMLVPLRNVEAVSRYIDKTHLGIRFEFESVPKEIKVPAASVGTRSLHKKLEVVSNSRFPEFTCWVQKMLREKFDYQCVESVDELSSCRKGLTIKGQVKNRDRYIKDDRYAVDDRSQWLLGADNMEKIDRLKEMGEAIKCELVEAQKKALSLDGMRSQAHDLVRMSKQLQDAEWEQYDVEGARRDYEEAKAHRIRLEKGSKSIAEASKLEQEAKLRKDEADKRLRDLKQAQLKAENDDIEIEKKLSEHEGLLRAAAPLSDDDRNVLEGLSNEADEKGTVSEVLDGTANEMAIERVRRKVDQLLVAEHERATRSQSESRSKGEAIIHNFRMRWPSATADLGMSFDEREAYIAIYNQIVTTGLPDYESRFLDILRDFSQDQMTAINQTIRNALHEVREGLEPVNSSLALSEYAPGIHLNIEARDCKNATVREFMEDLRAIAQGSWGDSDLATAETKYERTARIIRRFTSKEYADRTWKAACLDTRKHVNFIAKEIDEAGEVRNVHSTDTGLSGGQKQKLVIFCLAAALRYQLASEEQLVPSFGTVVLDEAFDKADYRFADTAMDIFEVFGFHMVLATPLKLLQTLEPHVGATVLVRCEEEKRSLLQSIDYSAERENATEGDCQLQTSEASSE